MFVCIISNQNNVITAQQCEIFTGDLNICLSRHYKQAQVQLICLNIKQMVEIILCKTALGSDRRLVITSLGQGGREEAGR